MISNSILEQLEIHSEDLLKSLPSEYQEDELIKLERILNDVFTEQIENNYPEDLEDAVVEALSWTSSLLDTIKKTSKMPRSSFFYKRLKELGQLLKTIKYYLEQDYSSEFSKVLADRR